MGKTEHSGLFLEKTLRLVAAELRYHSSAMLFDAWNKKKTKKVAR